MFRLGLSGTNWTGKSKTIHGLLKEHPSLNIETVSLSALVTQCPFPMVEMQTIKGSQWMVEQVSATVEGHNGEMQLFDRTPLDILAFTLYVESRTSRKSPKLIGDILDLFKYFDLIFYLQPSGEWPVNVYSTQNKIRFALQIDYYMREAINRFAIEVMLLPWKLEERQHLLSEHLLGLPST